jgi:hypothetical protein
VESRMPGNGHVRFGGRIEELEFRSLRTARVGVRAAGWVRRRG